jgi:ABC-type transport system involved in cytochrome c biogenesis ATPase subunit
MSHLEILGAFGPALAILDHMEKHNYLLYIGHQHGFRKGRSCVTQLIEVLDDWTEQLDNKNAIDTIYLYFQKAFDTVPHQLCFFPIIWQFSSLH